MSREMTPEEEITLRRQKAFDALSEEDKSLLYNPEEGYILIELSYSDRIILPYKKGLELLNIVSTAEQIDNSTNYDYPIIVPTELNFKFSLITKKTYTEYKMNELLGLHRADAEK